MKKLLLPICAVLMCMVSCQKEGNDILTLVMEEYGSDAKLHLDNENYTVWDNGDYIWLNGEQKQVSVDGTTATINTNMDNRAFTAIYPYDWVISTRDIAYPQVQKYELAGSVQKIVAPMAGVCGEGESTLKFYNLGCILAVEVTNDSSATMNVKKIEVIADNESTKLWGNYRIDYGTTHSISHLNDGSGDNKVTLDCGWSGVSIAANSSKKFYIAMPPVTAKLTVKVYDDYYYYSRGQSNSSQLQRSHGYNAGITASAAARTQYAPLNNQIMYTTNTGNAIDFEECYYLDAPTSQTMNEDGIWFATFANELTEIPDCTFGYLDGEETAFKSVTLPTSVTYIGGQSFCDNPYLEFISMPGVETIENTNSIYWYAFSDCQHLKTVILGPNIEYIGFKAFNGCSSIKNFYCYNTTPPTLGGDVFFRCNLGTATLHVPAERVSDYQDSGWDDIFGTIVGDL